MTINFFPPGQPSGWSPTFAPPMIPGCVLWLRADLGITLSGSTVSSWADQSGSGNNVTQGSGIKQLTYVASQGSYNGQPTLLGSASTYMQSGTWAVPPAQPMTIIAAFDNTSGVEYIVDGLTNNTMALFATSSSRMELDAGVGLATPTGIYAVQQVAAAVFNGASSALYQNSSRTPTLSGNVGTGPATGITIANQGAGAAGLVGNIAEVIAYSGLLSYAQLNTVFRYMGVRYGIAAS